MTRELQALKEGAHRHAGGLEMYPDGYQRQAIAHRHAGGIETQALIAAPKAQAHRHAGGLEISGLRSFDD